ncbi:GDP-mannose 4,6-dehydratase [Methylomonas albis]|uniref:GDP-mannose 4,6-dehydratase n=1 Tax=Methylomonas albis TaxID=1854563 RepID=A0ABR9CZU0_9GAMM|nr:GDP-mannose 4,6-dehydratase [Methylomonas albis]MBD9356066.1 GDP-mannose 4,6-dehydratase [Methylomonas albis]
MKTIVFGINSQDGHYLSELCKAKYMSVIGVSRSEGSWIKGDISIREQTESLIKTHKPQYLFHLAANSTTRHDALFENHETISTGTLIILEAVKRHSPDTKVFITGSGLQFVNTGTPISEHDEFEAGCAYSVARIQSVYAARYYRSLGIRAYVGYLFHHESPFRKPNHVSKMIALAAQRIAGGSNELIELGDISVKKEWTFAGDVAQGIFTLVEQDEIFEAVIGSGITYSIQDWLEACFEIIGKNWREHVRIREGFIPEYKQLVSNSETINALGWRPNVTFPDLAKIMMSST